MKQNVQKIFLILWLLQPIYLLASTSIIPKGKILHIPTNFIYKMQTTTWHTGCPIAPQKLRQVYVPYWGFDNKYHLGTFIVHHKIAKQVLKIFTYLAEQHFAIRSIIPIEYFAGNDQDSMAEDNTSAFNCRLLTGSESRYSIHSYGLAIDINPKENPYVLGSTIYPAAGLQFINRKTAREGMITKEGIVYKIFHAYQWNWGGDYKKMHDYQHMECIV